jgi:hypothetical protein
LIEFIAAAFEGELIFQQKRPDGAVMHATMRIGDSMLMLADATREFGPICLDHVQTNRYGGFWASAIVPVTIIEVRPFRNGWQAYEAPGVAPQFPEKHRRNRRRSRILRSFIDAESKQISFMLRIV